MPPDAPHTPAPAGGSVPAAGPASPTAPAVAALLVALTVSLLTSAAQSVVLSTRHFALDELIGFPREFVWWNCLAYLPFFLALWAGFLPLRRLWPRTFGVPVQAAAYVIFGVMCLGFLFPVLSRPALVMLALGIGVTSARGVERLLPSAVAHRAAAAVVLVLALLQGAGGFIVRRALEQERRDLPMVTVAPADPARPNVLVLLLDTVRAISLGSYGRTRATSPRIDAIARAGVRFESAFSTAPWTLPSHGALFTSLLPHQLEYSYTQAIRPTPAHLARLFRQQGWATGAAVANMYYAGWETGVGRGFDTFTDYRWTPRQVLLHAQVLQTEWARGLYRALLGGSPAEVARALVNVRWFNGERFPQFDRKWAPHVNRELLDFIGSVRDRPFFAFANYFDAHIPYAPPTDERLVFDSTGQRHPLDLYEGAIRYLDGHIGDLVRELERMGRLDNTILVITSDHGEQFGEHGFWEHGNSTYAPVVEVPLIIRLPRGEAGGRVVHGAVSIADLPRTIAALAGLPIDTFEGVSLVPLLKGARASRGEPVIAEYTQDPKVAGQPAIRWRSLMDDSLAYVESASVAGALYRLSDRKQESNLSGVAPFSALLPAYQALLDQKSPVPPGER